VRSAPKKRRPSGWIAAVSAAVLSRMNLRPTGIGPVRPAPRLMRPSRRMKAGPNICCENFGFKRGAKILVRTTVESTACLTLFE
jgi:hypothetical protein